MEGLCNGGCLRVPTESLLFARQLFALEHERLECDIIDPRWQLDGYNYDRTTCDKKTLTLLVARWRVT